MLHRRGFPNPYFGETITKLAALQHEIFKVQFSIFPPLSYVQQQTYRFVFMAGTCLHNVFLILRILYDFSLCWECPHLCMFSSSSAKSGIFRFWLNKIVQIMQKGGNTAPLRQVTMCQFSQNSDEQLLHNMCCTTQQCAHRLMHIPRLYNTCCEVTAHRNFVKIGTWLPILKALCFHIFA